jgi:hypothetical protein
MCLIVDPYCMPAMHAGLFLARNSVHGLLITDFIEQMITTCIHTSKWRTNEEVTSDVRIGMLHEFSHVLLTGF